MASHCVAVCCLFWSLTVVLLHFVPEKPKLCDVFAACRNNGPLGTCSSGTNNLNGCILLTCKPQVSSNVSFSNPHRLFFHCLKTEKFNYECNLDAPREPVGSSFKIDAPNLSCVLLQHPILHELVWRWWVQPISQFFMGNLCEQSTFGHSKTVNLTESAEIRCHNSITCGLSKSASLLEEIHRFGSVSDRTTKCEKFHHVTPNK